MLAALKHDPASAPLEERQRAIIDYSFKLTRAPQSITKDDVATLHRVGLSDLAIHDVVAVTAYFNFVNRMALGLGVEIESEKSEHS